jgi:hypothetical protein
VGFGWAAKAVPAKMVDRAMSVAVSIRKLVPSGCPIYNAHPRRGRCAGCSSPMKAGERSEVQSSPLGAVFGSTGLKPV